MVVVLFHGQLSFSFELMFYVPFNRFSVTFHRFSCVKPGLEVIKLEYSLKLKIKRNDWLLADTCPQTANHCALF